MRTYNIQDAKDGRPMVKVIALDTPEQAQVKRFGFMAGQIAVPDDFNVMGADELQRLFEDEA